MPCSKFVVFMLWMARYISPCLTTLQLRLGALEALLVILHTSENSNVIDRIMCALTAMLKNRQVGICPTRC